MKSTSSISVIIPAYNAARFITEAIASVQAQTHAPSEIIVVDDCSTDDTAARVEKIPSVTLIRHEKNGGVATARNTGASAASSEYLAFLDSDDLWDPEKLALQLAALKKAPVPELSFTHMRHTSREGSIRCMLPSSLVLSRDAFFDIGPFDTSLPSGEFFEWFARAKQRGYGYHCLDKQLVTRRAHDANITLKPETLQGYTKALKKIIDSRRHK